MDLHRPPSLSHDRRVVVTGVGIVTAFGAGWALNAEGFRSGRTAIRPVTLFDVSRQRVRQAAEVVLPAALPATGLTDRQVRRMDRAGRLLLCAAHEAWTQAEWEPSDDLPLVLGTTSGGMSHGEAYYRHAVGHPHRHQDQARRAAQYVLQRQPLDLCDAFGFTGSIQLVANACASGSNAIGLAWERIRRGDADRALTGGYDALSQLVFAGFDALQALSPTVCRPFDAQRDGLALGEGAAVLALETLASARRRGARILGEILGYGAATDVHHLTQPHPQGDAALRCMEAACASAGVGPGQVGYINAHGTGTPHNDVAEATAIQRWGGGRVATLPVSSVKSGIGHLLGAAGAVEAVACLMALAGQWLPPTPTLRTPDPVCRFPLVREPTAASFDVALSNSFGFGGANATLILRRWS